MFRVFWSPDPTASLGGTFTLLILYRLVLAWRFAKGLFIRGVNHELVYSLGFYLSYELG